MAMYGVTLSRQDIQEVWPSRIVGGHTQILARRAVLRATAVNFYAQGDYRGFLGFLLSA
ncbi:MAG: hypothetical protein ACFB8W_03275 [Elainellaceae cyanobacterium]